MNRVKIATTTTNMFETAFSTIAEQELLYNKDTKKLYIKYQSEAVQINSDDNEILLKEYVDQEIEKAKSHDIALKDKPQEPILAGSMWIDVSGIFIKDLDGQERRIATQDDGAAIPINWKYLQFDEDDDPSTQFGGEWEDISHLYAGEIPIIKSVDFVGLTSHEAILSTSDLSERHPVRSVILWKKIGMQDSFYFVEEVLYYLDSPYSGFYNNHFYENGLYKQGFAFYNELLFKDGNKYTGIYEEKLYMQGLSPKGSVVYEEILYVNGIRSVGYYDHQNQLYEDGAKYTHPTQIILKDNQVLSPTEVSGIASGERMYVDGLYIKNHTIAEDKDDLISKMGINNSNTSIPALAKRIYTGKIATLESLFQDYANLIDISSCYSWDTQSCLSLKHAFAGCSSVRNFESLRHWNTSSTKDFEGLFLNCSSTTNLGFIKGWDFLSATSLINMFKGCSSLEILDLSSFDTKNRPTKTNTFSGCTSVTTAYARTQDDCDYLNSSEGKPGNINFRTKPKA